METPAVESPVVETAVVETTPTEAQAASVSSPEPIIVEPDSDPVIRDSLAASTGAIVDQPKSKGGLLIGLSLIALLAAGGGAYALGLFGGPAAETNSVASAPITSAPEPDVDAPPADIEPETETTVLSAYQTAIKSGKITDLGKFAAAHPKSSLAKDAQDAAYASLQRQNSVLAFTTFSKFFPDADISTYTGPRTNADDPVGSPQSVVIELDQPAQISGQTPGQTTEPFLNIPAIRPSLTARAEELEPFIAQGDTGYTLSVIDELQAYPDLTEAEATFLLNLRAKAETSQGFTSPEFLPVNSSVTTAPAFDTAAVPIERFGAITPDYATEPGECNLTFSVNLSGTPTNIVASCTDPIFKLPAEQTVSEWSYSPALLAGSPVQQDDLAVTLKFHLEDTE